jgi:uncharacterized protein YbjT (DUF2867 family)
MNNEKAKKKIVVIGGTGLIGSKVVERLNEHGFEAVAASPGTGVNTITGEGLAQVLDGASVVVDVSNSPSFEDKAVMDFFTTSTKNLLKYEAQAGVKHHVALSIVGTDRLPDNGYFRAKVAQQNLIKESAIPYSIIQATQFFEFLPLITDLATEGDTVRLAPVKIQPMAADDVAAAVGKTAAGEPLNTTIEIGGPEVFQLDELVRTALSKKGDRRTVVSDPEARYFGSVLEERSLVPEDSARLGETRLADWVAAQAQQPMAVSGA